MNILALLELPEAAAAELAKRPEVTIIQAADYRPETAGEIDVIYGWGEPAAELIAGFNRVRFVQSTSAGVDYMPLARFEELGIQLANTSGIHAAPIAESVVGMALAFARGLVPVATEWDGQTRRKSMWELAGQTAVIFGTGHIGTAIAQKLGALGMTVNGVSQHGRPVAGFEEVGTDADAMALAQAADLVVNVMPLTPATHHFFDAAFFAELTRRPLFVNVGRGASVDTNALVQALATGQLRGAALDVVENEPLASDDPLWQTPGLLLTPHVSGTVAHLREKAFAILWPNVLGLLDTGAIVKNVVDLAAGY